jgi:hypothetical protein
VPTAVGATSSALLPFSHAVLRSPATCPHQVRSNRCGRSQGLWPHEGRRRQPPAAADFHDCWPSEVSFPEISARETSTTYKEGPQKGRSHFVTATSVFLNVPFDANYRRLFVAMVVGVTAHGAIPRCVLELPSSADRLKRLRRLIRVCSISFHDLSRVTSTRTTHGLVPRFNMPFELGLAMASPSAKCFLFEERPYRLQVSLSDVNGTDPLIHHADPLELLARIRDALYRRSLSLPAVRGAFDEVQRATRPVNVFSRAGFNQLVFRARVACSDRGLL